MDKIKISLSLEEVHLILSLLGLLKQLEHEHKKSLVDKYIIETQYLVLDQLNEKKLHDLAELAKTEILLKNL